MLDWLSKHIRIEFIFTPFATKNLMRNVSFGKIGRTDYFIFGVRIASIQKTVPWE